MTVTSFAGKSNGHLLFRRKKKNIGWGEYIVLAYEFKAIPDLTLSKYQVFEDSGIEGMIDAQTQFIRQLYRAAILGDVNIHFLFEYDPDRPEGNKINIRLLFTSSKENEDYFTKMRKLVKASGISNYFNFTEIQEQKITSAIYTHQCFMRKKERILETSVNNEKTYFYVVPNWKIRDHCRLYNIFKLMESFNEPCCYRVDLFAQKELEEKIHKSFENPLTYLRNSYTSSLLRREMKEMFDTSKSMLTPEEWLKRPVIIELESLGEGPANFVTLLLCTLIRETLKANPLGDKKKPVRHVIFIEEAHNLISSESSADKPEDSNPKIAATAFIVKMLAEVRALKEGIIIADQLPTAMAPEVIKNTNIKLVHRLTSQDDRELVGSTMSASALQLENMATYTKGHALYTYEDLLRPFDMQVERVPEHGEDTPTDQRLYELMMDEKKHPEYVELRKQEEMERWEKIKKSIQKFAGKCEQLTKQLEKVSFENISNNIMSKYIETVNNNCTVLVREKNNLSTQVQSLSDRFISHEKKENALSIIAEAGKSYGKMFDAKIHIWVQE